MIRIILAVLFINYLGAAQANPGDLDSAFGINGVKEIAIGEDAFASSLSINESSEILVGGVAFPSSRWAITKMNSIGQPVPAFGIGGTQIFQFSSLGGGINTFAHQDTSEIILGNDTGFGNSLIRVNQFGIQDMTFGLDGRTMIEFADTERPVASGLEVLRNGKILVSGYVRTSSTDTQGFILQLLQNGTVDSSFGSSGRILFNISGYRETLVLGFKVDLAQNNLFLAGSVCRDGPFCKQFIAKFNSNGQLDLNFGLDGFAYLSPQESGDPSFGGLALQGDGKIVAIGNRGGGGFGTEGYVSRFTSQGILDSSFGVSGITATIGGVTSFSFSNLAIDSGNGILATGQVNSSAGLLIRFNQNGIADSSFGKLGQVRFPSVGGRVIKIQPDGKILVAGTLTSKAGNYVFQVVRFFGAPRIAPAAVFVPIPTIGIPAALIMIIILVMTALFVGNFARD